MREVIAAVEDVAFADTTVLLLGESGTGKEVLARYIHSCSPRVEGPWVAVNCAALPAELLESELFGHERGAFTGASERRIGKIEQASGGTLLLDEISEMPLPLQAKLLRVIQEREVDRVGGGRPIPVDVRVIATSNRDLATMVEQKQFRADLFFRLNVFPIELPALRERREDLPGLVARLVGEIAARLGREAPALAPEVIARLEGYAFPGNVRELGNVLERAMLRCRGGALGLEHVDPALRGVRLSASGAVPVAPAAPPREEGAPPAQGTPATFQALPAGLPLGLAELERLAIVEALKRVNGNRTHAARLLGISIRTLRNKLREMRGAGISDGQVLPAEAAGNAAPSWDEPLARPSQERAA
jgi:two-component system response regulator FlrC